MAITHDALDLTSSHQMSALVGAHVTTHDVLGHNVQCTALPRHPHHLDMGPQCTGTHAGPLTWDLAIQRHKRHKSCKNITRKHSSRMYATHLENVHASGFSGHHQMSLAGVSPKD